MLVNCHVTTYWIGLRGYLLTYSGRPQRLARNFRTWFRAIAYRRRVAQVESSRGVMPQENPFIVGAVWQLVNLPVVVTSVFFILKSQCRLVNQPRATTRLLVQIEQISAPDYLVGPTVP